MEKALGIAALHGMAEKFKASNGWLTRWKEQYNISQRTITGESGDVSSHRFMIGVSAILHSRLRATGRLELCLLPDKGLAKK